MINHALHYAWNTIIWMVAWFFSKSTLNRDQIVRWRVCADNSSNDFYFGISTHLFLVQLPEICLWAHCISHVGLEEFENNAAHKNEMPYSWTRKFGQSRCQLRLWYLVFRYVSALYSFRDIPESCNSNLLTDKGSINSETSCFRFTCSIFFFEERVFPVQFLRDPRIMQHWWSLRFLNFGQGLLQLTCFYIVLREECRSYRLRGVPESCNIE